MRKLLTPEQKEAKRLYSLEYKERNKKRIKEQNRVYREAHKDKYKEWCEANKEHLQEQAKLYRKTNIVRITKNNLDYKKKE